MAKHANAQPALLTMTKLPKSVLAAPQPILFGMEGHASAAHQVPITTAARTSVFIALKE